MQKFYSFLLSVLLLLAGSTLSAQEKIILLNEGNWQSDNGRITYFENGKVVSNQWFREKNGFKLGDTPNDIIAVNDNLIAIAVNWSNIVQFITPEGKAVAATEDVPNNRKLATDGDYLYLSSYGHECGIDGHFAEFQKGFVAKIDVRTFKVVAAVEVGYEPEGIAFYKGHLFVANTEGYGRKQTAENKVLAVIKIATFQSKEAVPFWHDAKSLPAAARISADGTDAASANRAATWTKTKSVTQIEYGLPKATCFRFRPL